VRDDKKNNKAPQADDEAPEFASPLLDLRERGPNALAPPPQALGIWELAWPTIVASALQTLVRWADFMMVGDLGVEAVAGVGAAGQIYWMIQTLVMALSTGLVAILARAVGAGNMREADSALRQSILLGTIFGLVSWLAILPVLGPTIGILGVTDEVIAFGSDYLFWLLIGNIPLTLGFIFAAGLRAAGDARVPLYIGIVANLMNLFFNWVLIYGNLGAPALGVEGAGMASAIAMFIQLAIYWVMWSRGSLILKPLLKGFSFDRIMSKRILHIGYPASIEGIGFQVGILSFMALMSTFGTAEFTAYQIGVQILSLSFLAGNGFSIAASTLVGQHLGAGNPDAAMRSGWGSLAFSMVMMGALGAGLIAMAPMLAGWFIDDANVIALTVDFIWILGLAQPLMAIEFVVGGALRGAGDTRFPVFAIFTGLFVFRVLPAVIIVFYFGGSIQWVWSVLLLDYLVKGILLTERFRRGYWKTIEV
jgi:MATE family, multidrug efflux pump